MKKHRRFWSILAVAVLLMTAAGIPTLAAQDTEPTREQTFRVAIGGQIPDPTNLNLYAGASRSDTGLHQVVYEYLFYNNLQTGEFTPWLAESYEYNDDYSALTVHLRDGVTWSDGEPFTSDDIKFTYDLLRANPAMEWATNANEAVSSIDTPDPLTAVFNLTTPSPRFHLYREAFPAVQIWGGLTILPKHIWESVGDPLAFKNSDPIGTGPYVLEDASQNGLTYRLDPDYWGTTVFGHTPGPEVVQFEYLGDEQTVALALASNELDVATIGILSAGTFQQIAGENPAISAWTADLPYAWADPCPRALMIQNAHPPLDNPDVRYAISSLIDRDAIVQLAYEGITVPAEGIWPNYDANQPYMDAVADLYAEHPIDYDPDRAAELFAKAGVDPSDLTLRYTVSSDSVEDVKVSQVIADQLRAAGIDVQVEQMTAQAREPLLLTGDYDISFQAFCPGYITENLDLFNVKNFVPLGENAPWYERNSFRYNSPEFSAIVDQMLAIPPDDQEALIPLFHDAMAIWLPDMPVIPLVQAPALVPFNSTYWSGWPTATDPWNMPVSWWANFNLVLNGYPNAETGEWIGGVQPAAGT
jgi:peptide/nickel transport system substrate-binding protein